MTVQCACGTASGVTRATFTTRSECSVFSPSHGRKITTVSSSKHFSNVQTLMPADVFSGSDDGNIRLWRAKASARQGVKSAALRQKLQYDDALKERYKHMPEIRRIARHRHMPKQVKKAGEIKKEELKSIKRREENERRHTKKGQTRRKAEREKMVLAREQ